MEKPERTENAKSEGYHKRTYTLKKRDGAYAWIYDNGTERFPGITFANIASAIDYHDKIYARTYVRFDSKT